MDEETEAQRIQVVAPGAWPGIPLCHPVLPCVSREDPDRGIQTPRMHLWGLCREDQFGARGKGKIWKTALFLSGMFGFHSWRFILH